MNKCHRFVREVADLMGASRCLAQGLELCVYQCVTTVFNLWMRFAFVRSTREIVHNEVVNVTSDDLTARC